jgi:DNA-directed RNA polymerase subunit RPC12/RpoP
VKASHPFGKNYSYWKCPQCNSLNQSDSPAVCYRCGMRVAFELGKMPVRWEPVGEPEVALVPGPWFPYDDLSWLRG